MTNLTCQAREEAPFLKKFANDWPTQALAMQLLKNKRGYSYRRGYLEVPDKYAYLKNKAAKKTPQDSCGVLSGGEEDDARGEAGSSADRVASGSKSKRTAPVTAATQPQKKQKTLNTTTTRTRSTALAKGNVKQKAIELDNEDDDDEDEDDKTVDGEADNEGGLDGLEE